MANCITADHYGRTLERYPVLWIRIKKVRFLNQPFPLQPCCPSMFSIVFRSSRNNPLLADNEQASIVLIDSGLPEVALQQGAMMKTAKLLRVSQMSL